ncbi:MAG: magnesium/cobalt transporter CorA [SAR202 cluster bacterium]|nr:magnesium/cobalt transporter CorA [SAR202 cluster bacterium]
MPFKAYYLTPEGQLRAGLDEPAVRSAYESHQGLLWVDVEASSDEDGRFMERVFGFHRLHIEDCVSPEVHSPKVDDYGNYLFIIVNGINYAVEADLVATTELAVFVGKNFVVSSHNFPMPSVDTVARNIESAEARLMTRGADFMAHALIDSLVDHVIPTIDRMSEVTTELEEEAIYRPQQATLNALMKLKRSTLRLQRIMAPQRDLMARVSRGDYPLLRQETLIFFRDVYDHITAVQERNVAIQQRTDHCSLVFMSAVATRQNETVKVLSFVAAVLLPLNLVASIYGMNFDNMPELHWQWGYYAVLGFMAFLGLLIVAVLWARKLIGWGYRQVDRVGIFRVAGLTRRSAGANGQRGSQGYRSTARNNP